MRPAGLRLRLLLGAAAWIGGALLIAGFGISYLFSAHVERTARLDLTAQLNRLIALVDIKADPPALRQPLADPRFGVPFGGLYWQITDIKSGETGRSRSLWDGALVLKQPLVVPGQVYQVELSGPDGAPAIGLARRLDFHADDGTTREFAIVMAENRAGIEAAIAAFRSDLARALLILGIVLVLAAWAQVTIGLAPLNKIRKGIAAIRTGGNRRLEGRFPREVMPLTDEVNALIENQENSIAFARARAADLAHALKTQLTVLAAEAHELRLRGLDAEAHKIETIMVAMSETINHQLSLSRLRFRTRAEHYAVALDEVLSKLVKTLSRTPHGERIAWHLKLPEGENVDLDRPDLNELLGILLDNASQWAKSQVRIDATRHAQTILLTIADDGPGLEPEQIARLGERGQRLDERKSGTGIGIAIAQEIVELNHAQLHFDRDPRLGGLRVRLSLPRSVHPMPASDRQRSRAKTEGAEPAEPHPPHDSRAPSRP